MKKLKLEELNRDSLEQYKNKTKIPLVLVLDNIRSGMNVGAVFRTADAFIVEKIYLCGITVQPPHREVLKTSIGSTKSVDWEYEKYVETCIINLTNQGYQIIIIEQTDESIFLQDYNIHPEYKYALVFGNELGGVSESILKLVDDAIEVPQFGTKHSLNISVCAGIVIWTFWNVLYKSL